MRRIRLASTLALIILAAFVRSSPARADGHFVEFGGGLSSISSAQPFFNTPYDSLDRSFSTLLTLGTNLTSVNSLIGFGVALQGMYATATEPAGSFSTAALYPALRLEIWKLGFTAGYSPFVYATGTGQSMSKRNGGKSILLDAFILFPITPEIDFGLRGGQQRVSDSTGEATVTDYGLFFRLNFGLSDSQKKSRRNFKGWRYPFGREIN